MVDTPSANSDEDKNIQELYAQFLGPLYIQPQVSGVHGPI